MRDTFPITDNDAEIYRRLTQANTTAKRQDAYATLARMTGKSVEEINNRLDVLLVWLTCGISLEAPNAFIMAR